MIEFELGQRYDKSRFMAFLKTFLPDDYVQQEKILDINFKSNFITKAKSLGACKSIELEVLEVHHSSLNDARVGLSKDGFRLLLDQSYYNRALVVFLPEEGGQWRLSLIQMEAEMSEHSSRIQHSYSNPRRYSFLLGEGAHVKTPHQFLFEKGPVRERRENNKDLSKWDDLLSRFSVEALTKEFYNKLYHWYQWAVEESTGVYFPNKPETATDDRDAISANIIRLITRLLFVWFIKQKGLVPNNIFDTAELDKILADFDAQAKDSSVYYNAILQNLFFATLNNEIDKRAFVKPDFQGKCQSHGVKTLYRDDRKSSWFKISHEEFLKLFHRVPYMNCGLFECQDKYEKTDIGQLQDLLLDGFSSKGTIDKKTGHFKYRAFVPNCLFFAPEHEETVTIFDGNNTQQAVVKVQGIIKLFEEYNFTVEENTPVDVQVSLDPELLGRVFENLLAAYNPETGESARKSTGSFYTPREIVEYMVNESLIEYLKTHVPVSEALESQFRKLVSYLDNETELTDEQKDACLKALYDCKILDPACGSGAFPMGMLQQMVHIIKQLDPDNEKWRQIVLDKAIEESKKAFLMSKEVRPKKLEEIENEFDDDMTNPDYKRKLYIIQNCIYGVDIQPIAMLISKLRFFISLVCEQDKIDFEHPEDNYGINTLPNLETKFVSANTLLSPAINKYSGDWTVDENLKKLKDDLIDIRMRHFRVKTQRSKQDNKEKDEAKRDEIHNYIINSASKPDDELIANRKELIKQYFNELAQYREKKFEEVETPIDLFGETKTVTIDVNAAKRKELQDRIKACEEEIKREENKKNPAGFEAAVKQVTEWNPYDQNASAPFFSPEWMFGVNNGFDIVIGNPPYIQLQANEGLLASLYQDKGYETYNRSGDIYSLFYEQGWNLLKIKGSLCYITSNKWMRNDSGVETRNFLATKTNPKLLFDFAGLQLFDNATVETNIIIIAKDNNENSTFAITVGEKSSNPLKNIEAFALSNGIRMAFNSSEDWVILSPLEQSIKRKIEAVGTPLKDWDIRINYGIKTGFNNAFIINTGKRNEILANCQTDEERQRTEELIRPVLRGRDIKRYEFVDNGLFLLNTHNGVRDKYPRIDINDFPAIKAHLDNYWDRISVRADKGDTPYNLRNCAYLEDLICPKIVWGEISDRSKFCYDEKGKYFCEATTFLMTGDISPFMLCYLNSKLAEYLFSKIATRTGMGTTRWKKYKVEKLLVPNISKDIESKVEELYRQYKQSTNEKYLDEIDLIVYQLYGLNEEEIKIIEGTN